MRFSWVAIFILSQIVIACSGDEAPTEPVASASSSASVPDAPGAAETAVEDGTGTPVDAVSQNTGNPGKNQGGQASRTSAGAGEMVVTSGGLNVRSGPGMQHKPVRVLTKGAKISVESCDGHWCRITEGEFVAKKFLSESI